MKGQEDSGSQQQGDSSTSLASEISSQQTQNSVEQTQNYAVASMWHSAESETQAKIETMNSQPSKTSSQTGELLLMSSLCVWNLVQILQSCFFAWEYLLLSLSLRAQIQTLTPASLDKNYNVEICHNPFFLLTESVSDVQTLDRYLDLVMMRVF